MRSITEFEPALDEKGFRIRAGNVAPSTKAAILKEFTALQELIIGNLMQAYRSARSVAEASDDLARKLHIADLKRDLSSARAMLARYQRFCNETLSRMR